MSKSHRQALGLSVGFVLVCAGTAFAAVLVQPRTSAVPVTLPGISGSLAAPGLMFGTSFSGLGVTLNAPVSVVPVTTIEVRTERPSFTVKVAELNQGFADIATSPAMESDAGETDAHGAGKALEGLLTGQEEAPGSPATQEELSFTAQASLNFALAADDVGVERGHKANTMKGQDFLDMLVEADKRLSQAKAPSLRTREAASVVRQQVIRVVRALIDPAKPLAPQVRRVLSVWQVFNQEMEAASAKGLLEAIEAEARLFAEQVEASV
ncbi:MAG: hypothetical protein HY924_17130 [Elusimicrobia bacterium]|nr:hypothetical protein [Elusimicrobiota bacterium]